MQRSAKARWHMRNRGTEVSERAAISTTSTAVLPRKAVPMTSHTEVRSHSEPMMSSQGFRASGSGQHCTAGLLQHNTIYEDPPTHVVRKYEEEYRTNSGLSTRIILSQNSVWGVLNVTIVYL